MCCTPTLRWLIVSTLPLRLSPSSQPATGLSALAPAQRAGAQRLCALARMRSPIGRRVGLLGGEDSDVVVLAPNRREWPRAVDLPVDRAAGSLDLIPPWTKMTCSPASVSLRLRP